MTVIENSESVAFPQWCELRRYDIVALSAGRQGRLQRAAPREIIVAASGTGQVVQGNRSIVLRPGQFVECAPDVAEFELAPVSRDACFVRFAGVWGDEIGGCGAFDATVGDPSLIGDAVDYERNTSIDSHYHDYDEYWIVVSGSGIARVGETDHPVGPGDCVAIGTGWRHDFRWVDRPVRAVYLETTLMRTRRLGHLWQHTHGAALPDPERVWRG